MAAVYYRIWIDCITRFKNQPANKDNWPFLSMTSMSIAMTLNLALIFSILQKNILGYYFYEIDLSFLPSEIDDLFSFVILYSLPCISLNYLLIFKNDRYKALIAKYPYTNGGKLFLKYFIISMILPVLLVFVGMIFF
jgi:hypothetical protein